MMTKDIEKRLKSLDEITGNLNVKIEKLENVLLNLSDRTTDKETITKKELLNQLKWEGVIE